MRQRVRRGGSEFAGDAADGFSGDFGDGGSPFRRIGLNFLRQLVEANGVVLDKIGVVELLS